MADKDGPPAVRSTPQWTQDAQVGRRLRNLRTAAGMTKTELARQMRRRGFRWSQPTPGFAENGERHFKIDEIVALADILDVGQGELLPGMCVETPMDPRAAADLRAMGVEV